MSLKVLSCADIHLKGGFGTDEAEALLRVADIANERKVGLVAVNGDIFEGKSTVEQRLVFSEFLRRLQMKAIILRGNHDESGDLSNWQDIEGVYVHETPERQTTLYGELRLLTIPHCNPALIALETGSTKEMGEAATEYLQTLMDSYFNEIHTSKVPCMVLFHGEIDGMAYDNGYIPKDNGIHLKLASLKALGCPVVGGHLHFRQSDGNVHYSGNQDVLIFEHNGAKWLEPEVISLNKPSKLIIDDVFYGGAFTALDSLTADYSNTHVKFRYSVQRLEISIATAALTQVKEQLAGAKSLSIEQVVKLDVAVRNEFIAKATTIPDQLAVWMDAKGTQASSKEAALAKLHELVNDKTPALAAT
jgi:DNA repair exonuclease SbcCD nuclease subunit